MLSRLQEQLTELARSFTTHFLLVVFEDQIH